ncbi:hydrogenase nickel incorporation protein HypB [Pelotomaculum propionicicum]|uniref:hydrogenase nickel incorporation protein HypB n=1 Tax=Pelotomaculum propionicicum TaxID=258475 RepID=UPI003B81D6AF
MCLTCGCGEHDHDHDVRILQTMKTAFDRNNHIASRLREEFKEKCVLVLNLVSSPGAGKTTLLEKTVLALSSEYKMAVIEGDQETSNDAERIKKTGISAYQINTVSGCHLEAGMVKRALPSFDLDDLDILFIENVGNLICPTEYDLGEDFRVLVLSVAEGEDKPLKYPGIFMSSDIFLLNKIDLVDILEFDIEKCRKYLKRINKRAVTFEVSVRKGAGMDKWYGWLRSAVAQKKQK